MLRLFIKKNKNKKTNILIKFVVWLTLQRTNEPRCPFGSFSSMLCQAAHVGAAAENQTRSWVLSRPVTFFQRVEVRADWANGVDDEPAVGRVSGDSHCSGPTNLPLWLSAFAGPPLTQIASNLWLNHQRGASFHRLLADEYLSCKKWLFVTS